MICVPTARVSQGKRLLSDLRRQIPKGEHVQKNNHHTWRNEVFKPQQQQQQQRWRWRRWLRLVRCFLPLVSKPAKNKRAVLPLLLLLLLSSSTPPWSGSASLWRRAEETPSLSLSLTARGGGRRKCAHTCSRLQVEEADWSPAAAPPPLTALQEMSAR